MTKQRADRKKILPKGVPNLIFEKPERYDALDFKIHVPEELLDEAEAQWAPRDHFVFKLVPDAFAAFIEPIYSSIGSPIVEFKTFWGIYLSLIEAAIRADTDSNLELVEVLHAQATAPEAGEDQGIPLIPNQIRHEQTLIEAQGTTE